MYTDVCILMHVYCSSVCNQGVGNVHFPHSQLPSPFFNDKCMSWLLRIGLSLMILGELGNFSAYSFAPASVVAPLGMTTVLGKYLQYWWG